MTEGIDSDNSGSSPPTYRENESPKPVAPISVFSLKFSIEKILSPDFGRTPSSRNGDLRLDVGDDSSRSSTQSPPSELPNPANKTLWPAWVYCTRYSDRPSSGKRRPRSRRIKKKDKKPDEKRPRTAFTADQLARLKQEFQENRYLTEKRRQDLARDLRLNESQIKIWFQNKRAKIKKATGQRNPLALQLMAQGLYNHSTIPLRDDDDS